MEKSYYKVKSLLHPIGFSEPTSSKKEELQRRMIKRLQDEVGDELQDERWKRDDRKSNSLNGAA